ncbi:MAG TPA: cytochrome P460 family protein [Pirellulales bacterium]|jgi:hypothetical protein|nr:cytochrome P460 family protein [Pirellulales bacterium]
MSRTKILSGLLCAGFVLLLRGLSADEPQPDPPAPTEDRVGFPVDYATNYHVLRSKPVDLKKRQMVTVYGNDPAASIHKLADLPFPDGSVLVMETASVATDADGQPIIDKQGKFRKDKVVGLHVMRREKDFGAAYGKNQTGEWEYVEYRADKSYLTPPQKSFACAACHLKAGKDRDFVYHGPLPEKKSN